MNSYIPNIPHTEKKRVVVGWGKRPAYPQGHPQVAQAWSFVHLFTIVGVKNRLLIFLNWSWNYFSYDQSLRLLIKPKMKR